MARKVSPVGAHPEACCLLQCMPGEAFNVRVMLYPMLILQDEFGIYFLSYDLLKVPKRIIEGRENLLRELMRDLS